MIGSERKDADLDDALSHIRWAREANTDGKTVKTNRHLNRATELIERHLDTDND